MSKKKLTWEDYPRQKAKLALVGFAPSTRGLTPWDDDSYDIMSLNEGYNFKWMKRGNLWLQIHPHWDFEKGNNQNDPNHYLWMQNKSGPCVKCEGRGYLVKGEEQAKCDANGCDKGTYHPPAERKTLPVFTQEYYPDVYNCVKYPLDEIHDKFFRKYLGDKKYFTSSAAYMLGLGMLYGYEQIDLYGFEMGTSSEYHYQRANFEYMVGVAHGLGFDVRIPSKSPILKGQLYGIENMQQGYRQNVEMREVFLKGKEEKARAEMYKLAGSVEALKPLSDKNPKDEGLQKYTMQFLQKYHEALALLNVYSGAQREVENLKNLYDGYYRNGAETTTRSDEKLVQEHVYVSYGDEDGKEEN